MVVMSHCVCVSEVDKRVLRIGKHIYSVVLHSVKVEQRLIESQRH